MPMNANENDRARLEINARSFRPDPALERACELWDTDRAAFDRLPRSVISQHDIYRDMRQAWRAAREAGVYTPYSGPDAA